jgi:hypothetical protein
VKKTMQEKQEDKLKLEGKLVESIEFNELGELAKEYAESGIDLFIGNDVLKAIPIIDTIVKAFKVVGSIRDRLYLEKLVWFLLRIGETNQKQREDFVRENCKDTKRFEETILLIIEQADRIEKASLIGKIFKACILGKFSYEEALKLSNMVNRSFWGDLEDIIQNKKSVYEEKNYSLLQAGFFMVDYKTSAFEMCNPSDDGGILQRVLYKPSKYLHQLIEIASLT